MHAEQLVWIYEGVELIRGAFTRDNNVRTPKLIGELGAKVGGVDDQHVRVREKVARRSRRRATVLSLTRARWRCDAKIKSRWPERSESI